MSDLKDKILINIHKGILNGLLSNNDLLEIVKDAGDYLNPLTISKYAKEVGKSYQGMSKHRKHVIIFGEKFIIDNI